jgi:hypothetical protein
MPKDGPRRKLLVDKLTQLVEKDVGEPMSNADRPSFP